MMKSLLIVASALLFVELGLCAPETPQQLYEDARIYREFHHAAAQVGGDYYSWLATRGKQRPHQYALYYAGLAFVERGEWQKAAEYFDRFAQAKTLTPEDKAIAEIMRGLCDYNQGNAGHKKASQVWEKYATSKNPRVRSTVGYVYARANLSLDRAQTLCEGSTETDELKRNLGWVYLQQGKLEGARRLLEAVDLKGAPLVLDNQAETHDLLAKYYFFHPAVLSHLSTLYFTLAAEARPTLENAFAVGMSRYELGRHDDAIDALLLVQNNHFAAGQEKLNTIADTLTWLSGEDRTQWLSRLSAHLEAKRTRAIAADFTQSLILIKYYRQDVFTKFNPNHESDKIKDRLKFIAREIPWASKSARKDWLSEREKERKAGNIAAIATAVDALESDYENAQAALQDGTRYFYNAVQAPVWLGACYLKQGDSEKASKIWEDTKAQHATNPDFWTELGVGYSQLTVDEDYKNAAHQVATRLAESMDDRDLARGFSEKALNILVEYEADDIENSVVAPVDRKYFINLGLVLKSGTDERRALEALKKGRDESAWNDLEENGALFFAQLAQCYYPFKEFNELMILWLKLTEKYTASHQIHYMMRLIRLIHISDSSVPVIR